MIELINDSKQRMTFCSKISIGSDNNHWDKMIMSTSKRRGDRIRLLKRSFFILTHRSGLDDVCGSIFHFIPEGFDAALDVLQNHVVSAFLGQTHRLFDAEQNKPLELEQTRKGGATVSRI